jgi:broad specificity phosphatase PhoE
VFAYLVAHAHTQPVPDRDARTWGLSDLGRMQAAVLAREPFWDAVDFVAVSSEPKTRLTLEPALAGREVELLVDERLDELRRPTWLDTPALYRARVAQAFAAPEQPAGDWEPAATALARFLAAIEALSARFAGRTGVVVGHGLTLSLYRADLRGQPAPTLADWQRLDFAAVAEVDVARGALLADFRPVAPGLGPSRG